MNPRPPLGIGIFVAAPFYRVLHSVPMHGVGVRPIHVFFSFDIEALLWVCTIFSEQGATVRYRSQTPERAFIDAIGVWPVFLLGPDRTDFSTSLGAAISAWVEKRITN